MSVVSFVFASRTTALELERSPFGTERVEIERVHRYVHPAPLPNIVLLKHCYRTAQARPNPHAHS